jgi:hypothetical protein
MKNLLLIAGAVLGFVLLFNLLGRRDRASQPSAEGAYYAARAYVEDTMVRAKKVHPPGSAQVEELGSGRYRVHLLVDGVNAFNAPLRKTVVAEVRREGNGWRVTGAREIP